MLWLLDTTEILSGSPTSIRVQVCLGKLIIFKRPMEIQEHFPSNKTLYFNNNKKIRSKV